MQIELKIFITSPVLEQLENFQEADKQRTLNNAAYKLMQMGLHAYQESVKLQHKQAPTYHQNSLWDNFVELSHPEFEE